jgi:integrative and conjugative element protein (TIGR02256 family)
MMSISLAPDVEDRLRHALRQAGRREIGGMLFAEQLAPARFRLIDFSIDPSSGSHASFRRDPAAHASALKEFFDKTSNEFSRFNYLGEWHSHPSFSASPSLPDIETMQSMVESLDNEISFALLLIVRLRFWFWIDNSLTSFVRGYRPQRARFAAKVI